MKRTAVLLVLFLSGFGLRSAYGCLTPGSLIGGLDPQSFVFLGTVKGYTKPVKTVSGAPLDIFGLELNVDHKVYLAQEAKRYSLFPVRMMANCSQSGFNLDELRSKFPIGGKVRVIARKAEFTGQRSRDVITLEAGFVDHTSISVNPLNGSLFFTSLESVFDYQLFKPSAIVSNSEAYYFIAFEIQKDLVRLENARSTREVESILKRLENAPEYARIDTSAIRSEYIMRIR